MIFRVAGDADIGLMLRFSRERVGSGSCDLPRIPHDLLPLPAGPPRHSQLDHRPRPKSRYDGPHDLILAFRALSRELESPLGGPSSHGIRSEPVRPPAGIPFACPLPEAEAPFGPTASPAESRSAFVVSHHHDGLLHVKVTGLLHPATGQGFVAFPASRHQGGPKAALDTVGIPRDAVHTLRRFPSSAAVPHRCGRCPLAVTDHRPVLHPAEAAAVPSLPSRSREWQPCRSPSEERGPPSRRCRPPRLRRVELGAIDEVGRPAPEGTGKPAPRGRVQRKRGAGSESR
jgi:hypothetical protein